MPKLSEHTTSQFIKLLYIGDSGTGKTGSLTSLVKAGYRVRVLDMDAGIDTLAQYVKKECPEKLAEIDYETRRDKYVTGPLGPVIQGAPTAFVNALKLIDKWSDDSKPSEWGEKSILVIDSFSALGKAAFAWAKSLNPTSRDPRQWYGAAQEGLESVLMGLTSEAFKTNVIVISHVNYKEVFEGVHKGYVNAIGTALGPVIPRYFNTLVLAESTGSGKLVKRTIRTTPTGVIDLKTPITFKLDDALPLESGMATLFAKLQEK